MNAVMLSRASARLALSRLAESQHPKALRTYLDLTSAMAPARTWGTVVIRLGNGTLGLLASLGLPEPVVPCPYRTRWVATYQLPENPQVEVVVHATEQPPKRHTFHIPGGRRKLTRVSLHTTRRSHRMARKSRSAAPVDEIEELEELDELDELEEEEAPKPKRSRTRRSKKVVEEEEIEEEDEDEDDEDDDEDEEEEPEAKPRKRRTRKAPAKTTAKSKKSAPPPTRELPKGKLGVNDIAEMAGVEGRDVRVYLRKEGVPKDEELGRYAFTKKEATTLAKKVAAREKAKAAA